MEETFRGQSQHYEKNITEDVYNLTTKKLNRIHGNNANRTQQNAIDTNVKFVHNDGSKRSNHVVMDFCIDET